MRWVRALLLAACGAAATATGQASPIPSPDWREVATPRDRERLRHWRSAWVEGLRAARAGDGAAVIAADPALFDPDRVLAGALPPVGAYRCRAFKLGAGRPGNGVAVHPWGACRVEAEGSTIRLSRVDGPQRPTGLVFADTDARAILLGTMVFSDETRPLVYGRDAGRDVAAMIERIGRRRWRIVLPYPRFESTVDVVELVPVAS